MRERRSSACRAAARLLLPLLLLVFGAAAARARGPNADPPPPAYARLPARTVLALGYDRFVARYGNDLTGPDLDALNFHFAACHAWENDACATRRLSPAAVRQIAALRQLLSAWDEAKFSPADQFVGGELERGHHAARAAVERERLLEQIIGLLRRGKQPGRTASASTAATARARFARWLADSCKAATPLPEELDGQDPEMRAIVRARYGAWFANLKRLAQRVQTTAGALPAPAATARVLGYAARRL